MSIRKLSNNDKSTSPIGIMNKLGVNPSGYYSLAKRRLTDRQKNILELKSQIKQIFIHHKSLYGARKIAAILRNDGYQVYLRTVSKYMAQMGLKSRYRRRYTRTTISQNLSFALKNHLNREFTVNAPNKVWTSDITYIPIGKDGFVYLTVVIDLFSRMIVGWCVTETMDSEAILTSLRSAIDKRHPDDNLMFHTDRGIQFTSDSCSRLLGVKIHSFSRKGNPWDNAPTESFNALIKCEFLRHFEVESIEQARRLCFEYIEAFYNTTRIHGALGYRSPMEFENDY